MRDQNIGLILGLIDCVSLFHDSGNIRFIVSVNFMIKGIVHA